MYIVFLIKLCYIKDVKGTLWYLKRSKKTLMKGGFIYEQMEMAF